MPKVSEPHKVARRKQILDAAAACFAAHGLHRTSMRDICERAGLSPGAVYSYFVGKQAVIEALAAESARRAAEQAGRPAAEVLGELAQSDEPAAARFRLDVRLWAEALDDESVRAAFATGAGATRQGDALGALLTSVGLGVSLQRAIDPAFDARPALGALARLLAGARA